jgi:TonB family protein
MKQVFGVLAFYACIALGLSQENPDDTLARYKKQLELNPRSSLAHYRIAEIFMRQKNYQSAANEFREALNGDLDPAWIESRSHLSLAAIFDMTGQVDRALNEYAQANRSSVNEAPVVAVPVQRTEPEYSEEGRVAGLEGSVLLTAAIAEDGDAQEIRVTRPLGLGLDEKAIEAVRGWRFRPGVVATVAVDFRLPSKQSRWHLIRAAFDPPEGASRPVFRSAQYPLGAGVSRATIEEARIVAAVRRLARVTVLFDVDEEGQPVHLQVRNASDPVWGGEAIELVRGWRFDPGLKSGVPVAVPSMLELVWGQRNLSASALAQLSAATNQQPPPPDVFPPPPQGVQRIRIDGGIQALRLITTRTPEYPQLAKRARVQGVVRFYALIGSDGYVRNLRVISGDPLLVPAATDAVNQQVYRQTLLNGSPAEVATQVDVDFRLPEGPAQ